MAKYIVEYSAVCSIGTSFLEFVEQLVIGVDRQISRPCSQISEKNEEI